MSAAVDVSVKPKSLEHVASIIVNEHSKLTNATALYEERK